MKSIENLWLVVLPRLILGLFIIFNIIAMLTYPGSTYHDNLSLGYSLTQNFLSDLGRTVSFSGETNFFSSLFFNMGLILTGIVFTFHYFHIWRVFLQDSPQILSLIGSTFGMLGGLSLIGVGLTPSDLYLDIHIICSIWLFRFFFVASLCYSVVILRHARFENKFAGGYLFFTFSILLYIFVSEFGPDPELNQYALAIQVVSQKIILLIFMASIYIQTMGLKKL